MGENSVASWTKLASAALFLFYEKRSGPLMTVSHVGQLTLMHEFMFILSLFSFILCVCASVSTCLSMFVFLSTYLPIICFCFEFSL